MSRALYSPKIRFLDSNGNPLAGGKLYTYAAGTTTPLATYTSSAVSTPNANPVVLDANGEADVWTSGASYKLVLKNSLDVTQWTVDNVVNTIENSAITTALINDAAVTTAKINDAAVTTVKILDANVTRAKLAAGAISPMSVTASKTTTYTATTADDFIPCDATSAGFTVTLYTAVGNSGRRLIIEKTDSSTNAVTIDGLSTETIQGALTAVLKTQNESITIVSNGTEWRITARRTDFTSTTAWTDDQANSTTSVAVYREGRYVNAIGLTSFTGAATTGLNITIPAAYTIAAIHAASSGAIPEVGTAEMVDSGGFNCFGTVTASTTTSLLIGMKSAASTNVGFSNVTSTTPFTWGSGDTVAWRARWVVNGWEG